MAIFHVIGYAADGDRVIDVMVDDATDEGPDFYAFKMLHADGVICAQVYPDGAPGETVTALVTRCDPGVDWDEKAAEWGFGDGSLD